MCEQFAFIHVYRGRFGARLLCRVLVIDGADYRAWVRGRRKRRDRACSGRQMIRLIVAIHTAYPAYGVGRVTRELKRQGVEVGGHRVARSMPETGVGGIMRRQRRNVSRPDSSAATVST